jgi:DMSO/TMAO reductase YedYZ molybdopterin-dependent catalytic subunit
MKKIPLATRFIVSLLLTISLLVILALASVVAGTSFPAFIVFDFVSRQLPGNVVITGIETMVTVIRALNLGSTDTTAKLAERLMAIGLMALILIVASLLISAIISWIRNRTVTAESSVSRQKNWLLGTLLGVVLAAPILLLAAQSETSTVSLPVDLIWLTAAFVTWSVIHVVVYSRLYELDATPVLSTEQASVKVLSRRDFLIQIGGATAAITVVGGGLSALLSRSASLSRSIESVASTAVDATPVRVDAAGLLEPAPGTRPEYTPLDQHYRIDINVGSGPAIDGATYKLEITGLVENPAPITLEALQSQFQSMDQIITMSCISNPLGGDLISTTRWTGISMQDLVKLVKPKPEATHIHIYAADGFDEVVALDVIQKDPRVMLTYAWDGKPLTQEHGFPLRIHVPDHYGMKQPKWITRMDFVNQWAPGYWVVRGWDEEARVRTTSVIDTVATDHVFTVSGQKFVPIGGIAWSGVRGISRVQVKIDNSDWMDARLRKPLSDKSWVIWRYDWPFQPGSHTFAVRCYEGDGTPQIDTVAGTYPSGATGINTVSVGI